MQGLVRRCCLRTRLANNWPVFTRFKVGGVSPAPQESSFSSRGETAFGVLSGLYALRKKWVPAVGVVGFPLGWRYVLRSVRPRRLPLLFRHALGSHRQIPWVHLKRRSPSLTASGGAIIANPVQMTATAPALSTRVHPCHSSPARTDSQETRRQNI